MSQKVF